MVFQMTMSLESAGIYHTDNEVNTSIRPRKLDFQTQSNKYGI